MQVDTKIKAELDRLKAACAVNVFLLSALWGNRKPKNVEAMVQRMRDEWLRTDNMSDEAIEEAARMLRQFFMSR